MPRAKKRKDDSEIKEQKSIQEDSDIESMATHSFEETNTDESNNFISRATELKARDLKAHDLKPEQKTSEDEVTRSRLGKLIEGPKLKIGAKLNDKRLASGIKEEAGEQKRKLVFILDDDIPLTRVYTVRLEVEGYDVEVRHTGEEGIKWLAENKADVAIIDIMLPKFSGLTVIEAIRAKKPKFKTPLIFVSGLDQPEYSKKAKKLGAKSYLVKSKASVSEMIDEVEKALASKSTKKYKNLRKSKKTSKPRS